MKIFKLLCLILGLACNAYAQPTCEAPAASTCYYISPSGSDAAPGTYSDPWATWANITSYYNPSDKPAGYRTLSPGDVVYLRAGDYTHTYSYNGLNKSLYLRGVSGTSSKPISIKAYPGEAAIINASDCNSTAPCSAVEIESSNYISLSKFWVTGAYAQEGGGIRLDGSNDITLTDMIVAGNHGEESSNASGLSAVASNRVKVIRGIYRDNYELGLPSGGDDQNDTNIVIFGGSEWLIDSAFVGNTEPYNNLENRGGCLKYKHSCTAANCLEVKNTIFRNCAHAAVGLATQNANVHHSLIIDSERPVVVKNWGGKFHPTGIALHHLTIVDSHSIHYEPTAEYIPIGTFSAYDNVIIDSPASYGNEHGVWTVHPYGTNSQFSNVRSKAERFAVNGNCYYNGQPQPPAQKFSFFAAAGSYGSSGALYDLTAWRAFGYDTTSVFIDPQLDIEYAAQAPQCAGKGWKQPGTSSSSTSSSSSAPPITSPSSSSSSAAGACSCQCSETAPGDYSIQLSGSP